MAVAWERGDGTWRRRKQQGRPVVYIGGPGRVFRQDWTGRPDEFTGQPSPHFVAQARTLSRHRASE